MGITGLISFLEKASSKITIKDIQGSTVAIDTYCWLHKGAFACAEKLGRGEETDLHIQYCLKYVKLLLSYNIKPILVFDGRHLPAKSLTESRRKESRDLSKKRAAELLRIGQIEEAKSHMKRCVDITHEMALELIKECRKINVDCIVAPYEADAQLGYLNKCNIAEYIITEDSDLVLFGCKKIIFKFDLNGAGLLVDAEKLYLTMDCRLEKYTFDKFRYMCILSGCDYLDSLPGIGLAKSKKFFLKTEETDMRKALLKLPSYLNMKQLIVTTEYIENFLKANATFKYMFVYDPIERKMCRLNELENDEDLELCTNAGEILNNDIAFQLALGNLNPFTLKQLDNWNPDEKNMMLKYQHTNSWKQNTISKHKSIWKSDFKPHKNDTNKIVDIRCAMKFKKINISVADEVEEELEGNSEMEIFSLYSKTEPLPNTKRPHNETSPEKHEEELSIDRNQNNHNPFKKKQLTASSIENITILERNNENTPKILNLNKISKFNRTILNDKQKVISRFFNTETLLKNSNLKKEPNEEKTNEEKVNEEKINKEKEMIVDIVQEIRTSQEKQQNETASLYLSSPEAIIHDRGDRTPPKCSQSSDDTSSEPNSEEFLNNTNDSLPKSILDKFDYKPQNYDTISTDDIITLSDDDGKDIKKFKNATIKKQIKPTIRRIGLSKSKSLKTPSNQSRLSMFGFHKR